MKTGAIIGIIIAAVVADTASYGTTDGNAQ
jgi:hypothetical protein